jgi:hypothetical protein
MASASSPKDLGKALGAYFADPTVRRLPDDLAKTIAAYVQQHEEYDEAASDRLQTELSSVFDKHIKANPEAYGAWIAALRQLLPVLHTPERILYWFDRCQDTPDAAAVIKRNILDEALACLVDAVRFADENYDATESDASANPIVRRLLFEWIDRLYPAWAEGSGGGEYTERMVRDSLMHFGKKRPKVRCSAC